MKRLSLLLVALLALVCAYDAASVTSGRDVLVPAAARA